MSIVGTEKMRKKLVQKLVLKKSKNEGLIKQQINS